MVFLAPLLSVLLSASASVGAAPASSLQDPPPPHYPEWSGALTFGATWSAGNTEATTVNGNLNAVQRSEKDRWTFDAYTNYGKSKKLDTTTLTEVTTTTSNNHGGGAKYDYFASKKVYLFGNGSAKIDHVASLDLRTTLGAGAGYQWKESDKLKWGTELGLSFIDEDFEDNTADGNFLAARLASNLAYQLSKTSAFEQIAEAFPSLEDSDDFIAKVDSRLKMNITGKWIAQLQYVLEFDNSTPSFIQEADHRVVVSVGWGFGP